MSHVLADGSGRVREQTSAVRLRAERGHYGCEPFERTLERFNRSGTTRAVRCRDAAIGERQHHAISKKWPTIGSCARRIVRTMAPHAKTATARPESKPPSPLTSMPSTVKCLTMDPLITPTAITGPIEA